MLRGTTKSGFEFEIDEVRLNDMEFLDALAETQEDVLAFSKVNTMLLGTEQKKRLYDHLRDDNGHVPIEAMKEAIEDIFKSSGEDLKNS